LTIHKDCFIITSEKVKEHLIISNLGPEDGQTYR